MSIFDKVGDDAKKWLLNVAIGKAVKSAAKLIAAWCASKGVIFVATISGVTVDTGSEAAIVVAINSLLTILRNWIKVKWQVSWL